MTNSKKDTKQSRKVRPTPQLWSGLALPLVATALHPAIGLAQEEPPPPPPPSEVYFKRVTSTHLSSPQPCFDPEDPAKEGCFTHWLMLSDIDSDADLDILFANGGAYFQVGEAPEPSAVYLNDGQGAFLYVTDTRFGGAVNRNRQVSVGDIDGDGDMDIYQPGSWGIDSDKLWVQTAPGVWEDKAAEYMPGKPKSRVTSSTFGDLDGDGDLDLVAADWGDKPNQRPAENTSVGNTWVYLNDGEGRFTLQPPYVVPPAIPVTEGNTPLDIDLADVDGDFDLDIVLDHRNGQNRLFLNDGTGFFTDATAGYPRGRTYKYNQELCDIDLDGDLDLILDNAGPRPEGVTRGNFTQVLINDGLGVFTDKSREMIFGEVGSDDNAAKCADVNGDGLYDIVVSSLQSSTGEKLFINDGTGVFNNVEGAFTRMRDPSLGIAIADLNGDGILDAVTAQGEQNPQANQVYFGHGESKPDVTPPKFRAVEQPEAVPEEPFFIRAAVIDAHTSETGEHVKSVTLTYQVDGGEGIALPMYFIGGDLFRADIPAMPDGTTLTVTLSAVDRQDIESEPFTFELVIGTIEEPVEDAGVADAGEPDAGIGEGPVEDAGMSADGSDEPADGDDEPADGDDEPADGDDEPADGSDEPADGDDEPADGDAPVETDSGDGCSVSGPGSGNSTLAMLLGLLALGLFPERRRRRAKGQA